MTIRVIIASPTLDKRHGTERCVCEQVERLARHHGYDITIYSQRVEDIPGIATGLPSNDGPTPGRLVWRKIPALPGPHLLNYVWWFAANQVCRWLDRRKRGAQFDLVFSPGINCADADVMAVHMVFAEFHRRVAPELRFRSQPLGSWPQLLHRRLYYRLAIALERRYYTRRDVSLVAISRKTLDDITRFYGLPSNGNVVYHGIDLQLFSSEARLKLRSSARRALGIAESTFVWLLIGNDWKNKGLTCLLAAFARLQTKDSCLIVVGQDDPAPYQDSIERFHLAGRLRFLPLRADVETLYAAADAYVGPSLEDAFALPPAEAMAMGLPVIVSSRAGVSELVTHREDALVLQNPEDAGELFGLMEQVQSDSALRARLGANATRRMQQWTWDRNAAEMNRIFCAVLAGREAGSRVTARSPRSA